MAFGGYSYSTPIQNRDTLLKLSVVRILTITVVQTKESNSRWHLSIQMLHQGKALFLHSYIPKGVGEDGLQWQLRGNGFFDIRSCYLVLRGSQPMNFPWRSIWRVKAPRRVSLFVWSAAWERILTIDNLKRGYQLARWCCMCQCDGETVNHL